MLLDVFLLGRLLGRSVSRSVSLVGHLVHSWQTCSGAKQIGGPPTTSCPTKHAPIMSNKQLGGSSQAKNFVEEVSVTFFVRIADHFSSICLRGEHQTTTENGLAACALLPHTVAEANAAGLHRSMPRSVNPLPVPFRIRRFLPFALATPNRWSVNHRDVDDRKLRTC